MLLAQVTVTAKERVTVTAKEQVTFRPTIRACCLATMTNLELWLERELVPAALCLRKHCRRTM